MTTDKNYPTSPALNHCTKLQLSGSWLPLPQPLLHPATARSIADQHGFPLGSLLAIARGEAWWQGGPCLPPGRRWDDGRTDALWDWPPRLRWPPPTPGDPGWSEQRLTFSIYTAEDMAWREDARGGFGSAGLARVQAAHPDVALITQVMLPGAGSVAIGAFIDRRDELSRLLALGAPESIVQVAHRGLQCAFEDLLRSRRARPGRAA